MMVQKLRKTYFVLLLPAIFGFIITHYLKSHYQLTIGPFADSDSLSQALFVLAAGLAIAYPIFYRALFAHRNRFEKFVLKSELIKFERNLMAGALLTPYLALAAYCIDLPDFYLIGIFIMGLYASYFNYPTPKKIAFERSIFRVN